LGQDGAPPETDGGEWYEDAGDDAAEEEAVAEEEEATWQKAQGQRMPWRPAAWDADEATDGPSPGKRRRTQGAAR